MKGLIVLSLIGAALAQGPYVWDLQRPRMDAAAFAAMLATRENANYPTYAAIPQTSFNCGTRKPGFYADVEAQCQVFHRCDINGNLRSYLCVNQTIFDQVTLTCDYWFNVDCSRTPEFEDFANRRLYQQDLPLFDTPPDNYVAPQAPGSGQQTLGVGPGQAKPATPRRPPSQKPGSTGQVKAQAAAKPGASASAARASGMGVSVGGSAHMAGMSTNGQQQMTGEANAEASNDQEMASASDSVDTS